MANANTATQEVAALGGLTLPELRDRWAELFGNPPPKTLRKAFLLRACAYKIQEKAFGGLSGRTKRKLRKIADDISAGKPVSITPPRRFKPGTRLVRAWGGAVHTVTVTRDGFEYAGKRYGSLSAIAKEITGSQWNGPVFFGLEGLTTGAHGADSARSQALAGGGGGSAARTGADAASAPVKELEAIDNE